MQHRLQSNNGSNNGINNSYCLNESKFIKPEKNQVFICHL